MKKKVITLKFSVTPIRKSEYTGQLSMLPILPKEYVLKNMFLGKKMQIVLNTDTEIRIEYEGKLPGKALEAIEGFSNDGTIASVTYI